MTLLILFAVLMAVSSVSLLLVLRPSSEESRVEQRIAQLSRTSERAGDDSIIRDDRFSSQQALDDFLRRFSVFTTLRELIAQADLHWEVGHLLGGMGVLLVAAFALAFFFAPNAALALLLALLSAIAPLGYIYFKRAARLFRFQQHLPEAVDLMARAMRAGHPLASAVEIISLEIPDPVGFEFRRVFEEQSLGLPIREALLNLSHRVPVRDLQLLITAMLVQKETGGNLVEILEKTSTILRERARLLGQLRIYTAHGRLTGWVLCILPFAVFIGLTLLNPSYTEVLLRNPMGQKLSIAGLCFMAIGVLFIRKIIDVKV